MDFNTNYLLWKIELYREWKRNVFYYSIHENTFFTQDIHTCAKQISNIRENHFLNPIWNTFSQYKNITFRNFISHLKISTS